MTGTFTDSIGLDEKLGNKCSSLIVHHSSFLSNEI